MRAIAGRWRFTAERWATLSFYQRFESALALALTIIITLVILVAFYGLLVDVIGGLALGVTYWLMRERDDRLAREAAK